MQVRSLSLCVYVAREQVYCALKIATCMALAERILTSKKCPSASAFGYQMG